MSLNTPEQKELLTQLLYRLAADTGIDLSAARLSPTLYDAKLNSGVGGAESISLELHIDVRSPDAMKADAKRLHEIAQLITAAADKREKP